jgi:hypothetical protein
MAIDTSSVTLCNQLDCEDGRGWGGRDPSGGYFYPRFWGFRSSLCESRAGSLMVVSAVQVGEAWVGSGVGRTPRVPKWVPTSGPLFIRHPVCCRAGRSR